MTRSAVLAMGLCLGLATPAPAQDVVRLPKNPPANDVKAQRVWAKLATQKISLDFDDAPILDVFKFLKQTSGVNMVIDQALRAEGSLDDRRVSLEVTDIPLRSALNLVLDFSELAARWRHGVLFITTPGKARGDALLRIYDVRDITWKITSFPGPTLELASGSGMDDGGGLACGEDEGGDSTPTPDEIVETVRSALGEAADAEGTMMQLLGGIMVVRQSPEVHRQILEVLAMLRSSR